MATIKHIITGLRVVRRNWRVVIIAFLVKFGLAFLFFIPLHIFVDQSLRHRPAAGLLLENWDLTPIIDFVFSSRDALGHYAYFVPAALIIALVLHLFLGGGFFRTIAVGLGEDQNIFSTEKFFGWCGRYFWRFVKIALVSAIFYLAIAVLFIILSKLGLRLILGESISEPVRIFAALVRLIALILLLLVVHMSMTYAKITAVFREEMRLAGIAAATLWFLCNAFWRAILLQASLTVGLLIIVGVYLVLQKGCGLLPTAWTIVAVFLAQQALSLIRSWYRLIGYASQTDLYMKKFQIENCKL